MHCAGWVLRLPLYRRTYSSTLSAAAHREPGNYSSPNHPSYLIPRRLTLNLYSTVSKRPTPISKSLPICSTSGDLVLSIRRFIAQRSDVTLTALVDYHDLHVGLRTEESYCRIISRALSRKQLSIAHMLFQSLDHDGIKRGHLTKKVAVRYLIMRGRWPAAWNIVTDEIYPSKFRVQKEIPHDLWIELFRSPDMLAKRTHPRPITRTEEEEISESERYTLLLKNTPHIAMQSLSIHTKFWIIYAFIRVNQIDVALSLTRKTLENLPVHPRPSQLHWAVSIVDLVVFGGHWSGKGLKRYQAALKHVTELYSLHPRLKPSSTTLFHLISCLDGSRHAGRYSWNAIILGIKKWGTRVVDVKVLRKAATLALREGRLDIVRLLTLHRNALIGAGFGLVHRRWSYLPSEQTQMKRLKWKISRKRRLMRENNER